MKKAARLISSIALVLAIIICFSGCGLADFTRSLIGSDSNSTTATPVTEQTLQNLPNNTNSVTANVNVGTTSTSTNTNTPTTTAPPATQTQTQKPSSDNSVSSVTEVPEGTTENKADVGVKEQPVKDIQDLLFATDPNTASKVLKAAGFAYDETQGVYYTPLYPWQRYFGYNTIYDAAAPMTGMVFDTLRIEFVYKNKEWMVQLWKGQYGITAGAEIGLYNRDIDRVMQYDCADDEDLIEMQFDFYNQGEYVFSRGPEKHWWLTGFKVFHLGIPFTITLDMTLKFTDNAMATEFLKSLKKQQFNSVLNPIKYKRAGSTIRVVWGFMPDGLDF